MILSNIGLIDDKFGGRKLSSTEVLKMEINKLLQEKNSTILNLGDYDVLIMKIDNDQGYDLDSDLQDEEIAAVVARGYEDYQAGRVVSHEDLINRLRE